MLGSLFLLSLDLLRSCGLDGGDDFSDFLDLRVGLRMIPGLLGVSKGVLSVASVLLTIVLLLPTSCKFIIFSF